ncbi:MAG: glycosyltransferase, partial [Planctomycetes bacterium]|nr:glycosyltransferase [Planctomycetota bacterium]
MAQPKRTYVFAGGGTGGHLTPALAVAEEMLRNDNSARALFLCSNRPIDERFLADTGLGLGLGIGMVAQPIGPIPRNPLRWPAFYVRWRQSLHLARRILRDVKPAGVLGLGGFAAGPMVRQAARAGVRVALLNPDAIPGKANRYLARSVPAIFTQFEQTAGHFPPSNRRAVRLVGCPVRRKLIGQDRAAAIAELGLR